MDAKKVLEAALLCAARALPERELRSLFDGALDTPQLRNLLQQLKLDWQDRGLELVEIASGWRFQSRPELHIFLERLQPRQTPALQPGGIGDAGHHRLPPTRHAWRY